LQHPDLHWSFPFFKGEKVEIAVSQPFQGAWRNLLQDRPYFGLEEWVESTGADRKQLFISVHEALEINRKLGLKAFKGGRKILICWLPETMRVDTANKMLKLIEEPTDRTVMLFVSEHFDQLLATIRSRVQAVRVPRLDDAQAAAVIERLTGLDAATSQELAGVVEGNLAAALRLANAGGAAPDYELFVNWMRACWGTKGIELVDQSEAFAKPGREAMKRFLQYALHMIRQCIVGNYGAFDAVRLTARERAFAEKFAPFIHHGNVLEMQSLLEAAHRDIAGNVNGKLVFMDLSFKLSGLLRRPAETTGQ
jgi:DNA polymerase-3 subunit delta'